MAKKGKSKSVEVAQFGGEQQLGTVKMGHDYDLSTMEAESQTKLEHDEGHGAAIVIRCFKFRFNPEVLNHYTPTKQELFNAHHKGIEIALWKDGLTVFPDVNPRIVINEQDMTYEIFVGAKPSKGHILHENPKTLKEIVHG